MQDISEGKRPARPDMPSGGPPRLSAWLWGLEAGLTFTCLLVAVLVGQRFNAEIRDALVMIWLSGSLVFALLGWRGARQRQRLERFQAAVRLSQLVRESDVPEPLPPDLDAVIKVLEESLPQRQAESRIEDLLESLPQAAFLAGGNRLVTVNDRLVQRLGRSRRDLQDVSIDALDASEPFLGESADYAVLSDAHGGRHAFRIDRRLAARGQALGLLHDDSESHHQLYHLRQERDRARQESKLKSRYLGQLRRELESLEVTPADAESGSSLGERLAGLVSLLERVAETEADEAGQAGRADSTASGKRVLIVDDGPVNTALARRVLTDQGLLVDTARSGEEALDLAMEHSYALVFMDIYMPSLDGIETTRRWRQRESVRGGRSVMVALTANTSATDRARFFAAGMDDYLAKPYRPQALIDVVQRWLPGMIAPSIVS
ncbi:response regulator [Halomonas sp. IOP_31]|uniref:response regulator n=1 Tax=Halomonas sp. IOP_31 TaxID=2876584 RepID=UPI001E305696|nr:response regulator [Halomonas sp. IOP_31]MCD6007522.1 response regulator [Halomonas sp. IOP_31]